nr:GumC family protein [Aetokthonos hydrillicola]
MEPVSNFEEIDFQKYLQVLQRRWVPAVGTFGLIVILAFLYSISLKPIYKAEAILLISKNQTSALTGIGEAIGRLESLKSDSSGANSPLDTQVQIITSIPVLQEASDALQLKDSTGRPLKGGLPGKLKVEGVKGTDVINISYTDRDPQVAAKVVNQLTQVYIRHNIEANRAEAVSARKFIQQQLPGNEAAVKQAESALRKFKEQNKIISLEAEASAAVEETTKLEDQISQAQVQLENVRAQSQKLQAQAALASQEAVSVTSATEIPGIQQLVIQLQDAQSQLALMQSRFHTTHPSVVDLQEKVAALNKLLQQRIKQQGITTVPTGNLQNSQLRQQLISNFARTEVERAGLEKQIITLDNKLAAYKKRASILPRLEQTQRQLERRLKAAQTTYEALLTRLQQVQVTENQNIGNARVISPALVPDKPAASKQIAIIAGGSNCW